ncbi:MAG: methyltransferase domain-containing protein [Acidobacteriota bacterium]|nr:methyltransferase domain-containing protein [Acidobacteriota bacterium]
MDPRLQRRVQRYGWDKAVRRYEDSWKTQLEPAQDLMLEMAKLEPGERVLDVACGTGLVTRRVANAVGPDGEVIGTDISDEMVKTAREASPGLSNLGYERGEAEKIGFDDASFDAVLCGLGMMYVPSPPGALAEFHRVLRPGGRSAIAVWGARTNCGWAEIFPIVDARVHSEVCPAFFQLGTGDTLKIVMESAGFGGVEVERLRTTLHYSTQDDAILAAFVGGPVALAYSRFDDRTRTEAHTAYLDSIGPFRKDDGRYEIPGEFVVARGVKG